VYCDFFSVPRRSVAPPLMERVVRETVSQGLRFLEAAGPGARVETIFIGGGTPSCLPTGLLGELLGAFRPCTPSEWTVESNPETLTVSFLDACEAAGVNRLSVGIQTLHPRHLATLHRHATAEHARAALSLLRRRWKGRLNLDFITGIPGQTVPELLEDLAVADGSWPDHVSLYQLTVEPGTALEAQVQQGTMQANPLVLDEELWLAGRDQLQARGYAQYEVSNFSLAGKECAHNLRYWRLEPYWGAGPGAVSTVPGAWAGAVAGRPGLSSSTVVRLSVPRDIHGFLGGAAAGWGMDVEVIRPSDFLLECLMMGLRMSRGIEEGTLRSRFGGGLDELVPGLWDEWVRRGHAAPLEAAGGVRRLTPQGIMILDHLLGTVMDRLPRNQVDAAGVRWPDQGPVHGIA